MVETIDFFKFLLALGLYIRDPLEIADEVKKAFKVLDRRNNGYLMTSDIRDFLSKLGDVLTDEEIDEMIKLADIEMNGQIQYDQVRKQKKCNYLGRVKFDIKYQTKHINIFNPSPKGSYMGHIFELDI